jgi:DNA-binding response OmpR family regulator
MKILIIEDEKDLSNSITNYLSRDNFICESAFDFHRAMEMVAMNEYSCIILDITLPNGNGLNILTELRKNSNPTGVIIISARNSLTDKVNGLNIGADDYLSKPFHLPELAARVSAIMRRKIFDGNNKIVLDKLTVDIHERTVRGEKDIIDLTRKEYELLLYFISNKNKVVTKESIVEHLWGDSIDMLPNYDFIYTHVKNLRKKLIDHACPDYIKAVYGVGYKFAVSEPKPAS